MLSVSNSTPSFYVCNQNISQHYTTFIVDLACNRKVCNNIHSNPLHLVEKLGYCKNMTLEGTKLEERLRNVIKNVGSELIGNEITDGISYMLMGLGGGIIGLLEVILLGYFYNKRRQNLGVVREERVDEISLD